MLGRWNVNTSFQTHSELIVKCNIECRSDVYASHSETHSSSHRASHWKSFQLFSFRFEFRGKTSNEWCFTIYSIRVAFAHRTFECDFCVTERSLHIVHSAMCFHRHLKRNSNCEFLCDERRDSTRCKNGFLFVNWWDECGDLSRIRHLFLLFCAFFPARKNPGGGFYDLCEAHFSCFYVVGYNVNGMLWVLV